MKGKSLGTVTLEERNEIQVLFERKNGLSELAMVLSSDNNALYERLVHDMGETSVRFQQWWSRMCEKYNWEKADGGHWEIDFDTCEIFLCSGDAS